jgi:hypothetical protein
VAATGGKTFGLTEGSATLSNVTVATFTDPGNPDGTREDASDYSATINWGDGTSSAGTITNNNNGTWKVTGSHTYSGDTVNGESEGAATISVTISHDATTPQVVTDTATITDPAVVATGGFVVTATEGADSGSQTVATFTDPGNPSGTTEDANDYAASINWGDGQTSTGTITNNNGTWTVTGHHSYTEESSADHSGFADGYHLTVTISHDATTATASSTATVADQPVVVMGKNISATQGTPTGIVTVATFTDPGTPAGEAVSDYSANINWGDSSSSTGTIVPNGDGSFSVQGNHTYNNSGTFTITTSVSHEQSIGAGPGTSQATVASAGCPPVATQIVSNFNGTPIAGGNYIWFNSVLNVKGLNTSQTTTVTFTGQTITFTAGSTTYHLAVPDATITYGGTSTATTSFSGGSWVTTVPASGLAGNVFLAGLAFQVPSGGLPGGINPVTWSGAFDADTPGLTVQWQWAAAVYTQFTTNYNTLGVKPVDDTKASMYQNSDHAGTPESSSPNYKSFVTGGARGGGGSNWTGSYSGTAAVTPCGINTGDFASIGFWHNSNGQNLISQLGGVGSWLVTNYPHLYGTGGITPLTGSVASFYQTLYSSNQTYAQILATALALYTTESSLVGSASGLAQSLGFNVSTTGSGMDDYNVGSNGGIFSPTFTNNTFQDVSDILKGADAAAAAPSTFNSNLSKFNAIFSGINQGGHIANALDAPPAGTVAYTPAQIRTAYGLNNLSLDGTGQTIAIVDAYDDPNIYQAVDTFDTEFGLTASGPTLYQQYGQAASFLTVLNQSGQSTSLPGLDPTGAGSANWELEAALDVEWIHAIAPGARIVLVEANSQSLSDLMASVATAASQPGVSVVSMSWGFPEGQSVFASDEATYNSDFTTPGVTFVASTGDYGTADPEFPAFSPNVVAVGGTSLSLNADNSYNGETGWGYYSNSVGAYIASGGGLSLYQPEPAYQQGVQSTGSRTTPDVSLFADPATGAWIADTYNLDPTNPFEVVGGTSVSAPAWAGLFALVNQSRVAGGQAVLNSSSPTETQQALYSLPQADYNVISSGSNGYNANPGYNLVTGLGTPIANLLVIDLTAYHGPGTTYSGSTVGPLLDATLHNTGTGGSGTIDVFSVFGALTATGQELDFVRDASPSTGPVSVPTVTPPATAGAAGGIVTPHDLGATAPLGTASPLAAAGTNGAVAPSSALNGSAALNSATQPGSAGLTAMPSASSTATLTLGVATPLNTSTFTQVATSFLPQAGATQQSAGSAARPDVHSQTGWWHSVAITQTGRPAQRHRILADPRTSLVLDAALEALASDAVLLRGQEDGGTISEQARASVEAAGTTVLVNPNPQDDSSRDTDGPSAGLSNVLMAAGLLGLRGLAAKTPKARSRSSRKRSHKFGPRIR